MSHQKSSLFVFVYFYKDAVVEQAKWDPTKIRDKLQRDIDAHVASVRAAKLSELSAQFEVRHFFFEVILEKIFIGHRQWDLGL